MDHSLIQTWLNEDGTYQLGKALYLQFGTNRRLKTRLTQIHQSNPRIMKDLTAAMKQMIPEEVDLDGFEIISKDQFLIEVATKDLQIPFEKLSIEEALEVDQLENENARLYSQRALLSNRFVQDNGSSIQIIENAKIVDEIEVIVSNMQENRKKIRLSGKERISTSSDRKIAVYLRDINYTIADLQLLNYAELNQLRDKIRQQLAKAKKRIISSKTKKAKTDNEQKVIAKENELKIVDQIRKEIRDETTSG